MKTVSGGMKTYQKHTSRQYETHCDLGRAGIIKVCNLGGARIIKACNLGRARIIKVCNLGRARIIKVCDLGGARTIKIQDAISGELESSKSRTVAFVEKTKLRRKIPANY
jgi:hypothetical protein